MCVSRISVTFQNNRSGWIEIVRDKSLRDKSSYPTCEDAACSDDKFRVADDVPEKRSVIGRRSGCLPFSCRAISASRGTVSTRS